MIHVFQRLETSSADVETDSYPPPLKDTRTLDLFALALSWVLSLYLTSFSYGFFRFDALSPISLPAFREPVDKIISIKMDSKHKPSPNSPEPSHDDDDLFPTSEAAPPSYSASYSQPDNMPCVFPKPRSIFILRIIPH